MSNTLFPIIAEIPGIIFDILFWIILGTVMGFIARAILPGEQKMGIVSTILLGAVGAALGGFIALKVGFDVSNIFSVASIASSVIGSLVLLIAWCLIFKRNWK